ncbi:protein FD-like [Lotus japonicus]|uniref:BZIP domain-containing protein n=1 Tax=Lotus japonicus TaxID=34305 RepID=I3SF30_LOTJA|nr:protein FD-like [Lotus japonicus]AFK38872.1 unknown [Lotus japonicus]
MDPSPCNCWNHFTKPPSPTPSSSSEVWKDLKLSSLCDSSMEMEASSPWHSLCPASSVFQKQSHQHHSMLSSFNTSFDASSSSGEKIAQQDRVYAFSDQRRKRILKNRESALRSRARKQAYKKGLEMKLALLTEENSRLKSHVAELQFRLSSAKPAKGGAVYRTMSSPF